MTRLTEIREAFNGARRENADLLYPESATWSDATTCRFKVRIRQEWQRRSATGSTPIRWTPVCGD